MRAWACLANSMAIVALFLGCAPGYPTTAPVHGTVTFEGRPVPYGEVRFISEKGNIAMGYIKPDGSYRLTTFQSEDGAVPGSHGVAVSTRAARGGRGDVGLFTLPRRYEAPETSPLRYEVRPGINRIDLELKDDDGEVAVSEDR